MVLNLGLSIIIILYNQSNLISRVEVQEKLLQNNIFKQTLSDEISRIGNKPDTGDPIASILKNFFDQNNDVLKDIHLFDDAGSLRISVPNKKNLTANESDDKTALDKRLVLKLFFKYKIDKTDYLYETESDRLLFTYMILSVKEKIFILKTVQNLESFLRYSNLLFTQIFIVFLISLSIHAVFSILIYKNIILPIRRLNKSTKEVIHGNLDERIGIISDDEIGELSNSFNEMMVSVQNLKNEALDSNPLTGLPGNIVVMNQIQKRIESRDLFALAYIDVDNFKPFNDKFGFIAGDQAISLVGNILKDMRLKYNDLFVGHIGGDDFIYISDYADFEKIGNEILKEFAEKSKRLYPPDILKSGFYISRTRTGEVQMFNLLTISIGVVTNYSRDFASFAEINQEVAEMKKYAKSFEGNVIKADKREYEI